MSLSVNLPTDLARATPSRQCPALFTRQVTIGELPKDATVKELNVCPHVDCSKAVSLGFPGSISINEIIRDFINTHLRRKPEIEVPAAKRPAYPCKE